MDKKEQKNDELYEYLTEIPPPNEEFEMSESQKKCWFWIGNEIL